jgi:hypothetical protein
MVIFAAKKKRGEGADIASAACIALWVGYFAGGRHPEFR